MKQEFHHKPRGNSRSRGHSSGLEPDWSLSLSRVPCKEESYKESDGGRVKHHLCKSRRKQSPTRAKAGEAKRGAASVPHTTHLFRPEHRCCALPSGACPSLPEVGPSYQFVN